MADPVAIITYTDTPIDPSTLPQNVVLSGATSTPGDGSSITGYQWHLLDKPPGSTAVLVDDTTATCTLTGIDLEGTYRLFLVVENNLGDFSFQEPTPQQLGVAPYSFTAPPASAFKTVTVETANAGLIKVAHGERGWLARGLWPVVDEVDDLRGEHDTLRTDFDSHTIADHDTTATGPQLSALTAGASSNASSLHTHNSLPNVSIGDGEVTGFFNTDAVTPRTNGIGVAVRGAGGHSYDLATDVIQADTNNSGVIIKKKGVYPYDLRAERASFDRIDGRSFAPVPTQYFNKFVNTGTTGTVEEKIWEAVIPSSEMDQEAIGGRIVFTSFLEFAANANTKIWKVKIDDGVTTTTLKSVSSTVNGVTAAGILYIMINGTSGADTILRVALETKSSTPANFFEYDAIAYTALTGANWTISLWLETPTTPNDVSCIWGSLSYEPPVYT